MAGLVKLIFYIIIGYIFYKSYKVIVNSFRSTSNRNSGQDIFERENVKSKINKKEVIDAEFEDISDKENQPTEK